MNVKKKNELIIPSTLNIQKKTKENIIVANVLKKF